MPYTILLQKRPASKLWLYSNGSDLAWCDSAREFHKLFPGKFSYRAAHDENVTIPNGYRVVGGGLADTYIERIPRNTNKAFFAGLCKALSEPKE